LAFLDLTGLTRYTNKMKSWVTGRFANSLGTTESGYALDARQGTQLMVYKKDCGTISSLPATINDTEITNDMVVVHSELGTLAAQVGYWTVTTSNGSLRISGTIEGSTTVTLYLARGRS